MAIPALENPPPHGLQTDRALQDGDDLLLPPVNAGLARVLPPAGVFALLNEGLTGLAVGLTINIDRVGMNDLSVLYLNTSAEFVLKFSVRHQSCSSLSLNLLLFFPGCFLDFREKK